MIISFLFSGHGGASSSNTSENEYVDLEYELPEFSQTAFEKSVDSSSVIAIRGKMPEIKEEEAKREWIQTLDKITRASEKDIMPYMRIEGGPLEAYGYDMYGNIIVAFSEDEVKELDVSTVDEIYQILNKESKESSSVSDIPVKFTYLGPIVNESRTSQWSPLIGGIKLNYNSRRSTLSFAAFKRSTEEKGFVMSGHEAINAGGIGAAIYHPTTANQIGVIDDIGWPYADAAWVTTDDITCELYHLDTDILKDVTSYCDPEVGWGVYKSGINTSTTVGQVLELYRLADGGNLHDQVTADYDSGAGDSGSPIYAPGAAGTGMEIMGVHRGRFVTSDVAVFSPISGVITDLDVVPYTTYHIDWNPWNDPDSDSGSLITTSEQQEAVNCWLNDIPAPITGAEVTTNRLQHIISYWLSDDPMPPGAGA